MIRNFLLRILITSVAAYVTAWLLPGSTLDGYTSAIILSLVLAFLNLFVKPLLIILTIPFTLLTFGLFLLVINAFIILLADEMMKGFAVSSFLQAFIFSFIMAFIILLIEKLIEQISGNPTR